MVRSATAQEQAVRRQQDRVVRCLWLCYSGTWRTLPTSRPHLSTRVPQAVHVQPPHRNSRSRFGTRARGAGILQWGQCAAFTLMPHLFLTLVPYTTSITAPKTKRPRSATRSTNSNIVTVRTSVGPSGNPPALWPRPHRADCLHPISLRGLPTANLQALRLPLRADTQRPRHQSHLQHSLRRHLHRPSFVCQPTMCGLHLGAHAEPLCCSLAPHCLDIAFAGELMAFAVVRCLRLLRVSRASLFPCQEARCL